MVLPGTTIPLTNETTHNDCYSMKPIWEACQLNNSKLSLNKYVAISNKKFYTNRYETMYFIGI